MGSAGLRNLAHRSWRAWRVNPLILCAIILISLLGLMSLDKKLAERAGSLDRARQAFVTALADTRTQLAGLLAVVSGDKRIQKAIDWQLSHSTEQTLKAFLQRGAMDHLAIFHSDCKLVAHASLGEGLSPTCPDSDRNKSGIRWSREAGVPVLTLHRPIDGSLIAVGRVHLQREWLSLYPHMQTAMDHLDLSIVTNLKDKQVMIVGEGLQTNGDFAATLVSSGLIDALALQWGEENRAVFPAVQYLLAICLFLLAVTRWRMREGERRAKRELGNFVDWCRSLSPLAIHSAAETDAISLPNAQKFISIALQTKIDTLRQLSGRRDHLEMTLRSRERESQQLQRRLADLAELDSLAGQLQESIAAFIQRLHQLHHKTRTLENLLQAGIGDSSQSLFTAIEQWRAGIQEKGARKFLRGMSETPGRDESLSLLDEQLDQMQETIVKLHEQAITGALMTDEIVEAAALAGQIASHWHSLATIDHQIELPETLDHALEQATQLVCLTHSFRLDSQIATTPLPPVPEKIWIAALHHLLLAQIELWDTSREEHELTITAKTKTHGDHGWLILAFNEQPKFTPPRSETNHHLEVAKAILGPFPIELTMLPVRESMPPLALRWSLHEASLPSASNGNTALLGPSTVGEQFDRT